MKKRKIQKRRRRPLQSLTRFFIRDKEELPSAPFPMKEKIDPSDSGYKVVTPVGSAIKISK
ncbi:MAG: hypothetical protein ACKPKO_57155, partial [Candidatus Fonsibacter sp.]